MRWHRLAAVVAIVLASLSVGSAASAGAQRHRWWQSPELQAELGLTDTQSAALQKIFQAALPDLRRLMQALNDEEEALATLVDAADTDEDTVARQIDRVEAARSALGKTRTLMLYRLNRELTPAQRQALRAWSERNGRRQRRSPPDR